MNGYIVPLLGSAARTAAGNGDAIDLCQYVDAQRACPPMLRVMLDVTAVTGTSPTMTCFVEDSVDGVNWNSIGVFTAATAAVKQVINVGIRGDAYPANFAWPFNYRRVRVRWTMGGTSPNFTFSVKANVL